VAEGHARHPVAAADRVAELPAHSHVWRQDHNGFSHQDPGFIDHVVNKKAEIVRVYLPPDANCLLSVADHCLRSRTTSTSSWPASSRRSTT
jgi:phosphoketolase